MKQIAGLNGIRAVAFLIVFVSHAGIQAKVPGGLGVDIFFYLSGFLITTLMRRELEAHQRLYLASFYIRRAARILPPLFISLLAASLLSWTGLLNDPWTWQGLLSEVTFMANWVFIFGDPGSVHNAIPLWSLCVEEHYYVAFPVVLWLAWRLGRSIRALGWVVAACLAASVIWRVWMVLGAHATGHRIYMGTDTNIDMLLWGSLFAMRANPTYGEARAASRMACWWPAAMALLCGYGYVAARYGYSPVVVAAEPFVYAPLMLVLIHAVTLGYGAWIWQAKLLEWIGSISYEAYLLHVIALWVVARSTSPNGAIGDAALALVVTMASSWLLHRWIGQPLRDWARRADTRSHEQAQRSSHSRRPVPSPR